MEILAGKRSEINADLMRAVAISLVVVLHISANAFYVFGDYWNMYLIYDSLARSCVPVFFMISGALLLNKNEPALVFYKKRLTKILIPLVFWSYVYILYRKYYVGESLLSLSPMTFINGPVYYHLWFLYSIISVYIFIPMLRFYSINASQQVKLITLSIWFLSQSALPFLSYSGYDISISIDLGFVSRFIGFALLGDYLASYPLKLKRLNSLILFIISNLLTALMTYKYSLATAAPNEIWFQYNSPFVILSAIMLFSFMAKSKTESKLIKRLSSFSFGIYFVHIIIMQQVVIRFILTPDNYHNAISVLLLPIGIITCLAISMLICFALSKIKYVNRVI